MTAFDTVRWYLDKRDDRAGWAALDTIQQRIDELTRAANYWEREARGTRKELELALRTIDRSNEDLRILRQAITEKP